MIPLKIQMSSFIELVELLGWVDNEVLLFFCCQRYSLSLLHWSNRYKFLNMSFGVLCSCYFLSTASIYNKSDQRGCFLAGGSLCGISVHKKGSSWRKDMCRWYTWCYSSGEHNCFLVVTLKMMIEKQILIRFTMLLVNAEWPFFSVVHVSLYQAYLDLMPAVHAEIVWLIMVLNSANCVTHWNLIFFVHMFPELIPPLLLLLYGEHWLSFCIMYLASQFIAFFSSMLFYFLVIY